VRVEDGEFDRAIADLRSATLARRPDGAFVEVTDANDEHLVRAMAFVGVRAVRESITLAPVEGMRAVGYVHDLFRTLACCDLAVVQGGLTTTMELVANRRPFISIPLRNHFEQNHHVVHRLRRYGAPEPTRYDDATTERLAAQMLERLGAPVDYAPVEADGAARAAQLIAPLLEERKGWRARTRPIGERSPDAQRA
jgi:UDP:flavonoid glycosyltransferase YjiC (YdhE family)